MTARRKGRLKDATADKIEYWPVEQLRADPRNSRTHTKEQIAQLRSSFREFGWTYPILIQTDGTVVAGHARLEAARAEGAVEAKVLVVSGMSKAQIRAYVIADNQTALNAGWDEEILKAELAALKADGFNMEAMGFDDAALERLMMEAAAATPPTDFPSYDEGIDTEHQCPQCGYKWSGVSSAAPESE